MVLGRYGSRNTIMRCAWSESVGLTSIETILEVKYQLFPLQRKGPSVPSIRSSDPKGGSRPDPHRFRNRERGTQCNVGGRKWFEPS